MTENRIRVLLVDDHSIVRSGLRAILGAAEDIQVAGEARDGSEALMLVEGVNPDVVVMDLAMTGMDGREATRRILEANPARKVLVLTMHQEEDYLVPLLEAGALGFLVKSAADTELVTAIRTVARGELYVRAEAARVLARELRRTDQYASERAQFAELSEREQQVLRLSAQGFTAPEIGDKLGISPKTVDTYKHKLGEKLGLAHRSDYVRFALRLGILGEEG